MSQLKIVCSLPTFYKNLALNIRSAEEIDSDSMKYFRILHKELLDRGIYLGPSGYEVGFVCEAHTQDDLIKTAKAFGEALEIASLIP